MAWFFVLNIFALLLSDVLESNNIVVKNSPINLFLNLAFYLITPTFYITISYFIEPAKKWRKKNYLHFGLVGLVIISEFCYVLFNEVLNKQAEAVLSFIINIFFVIHVLVYLYLSLKKIHKHQKSIYLFSKCR
jgi:hypothetical protein